MEHLFEVHVVNSKAKIIHIWIVHSLDALSAEGILRVLDKDAREEGDEPIIPDGCHLVTGPLEMENGVEQII